MSTRVNKEKRVVRRGVSIASNLTALRSSKKIETRLADSAAASWSTAGQLARTGRSLWRGDWCRFDLLSTAHLVFRRLIILFIGRLLQGVQLSLLGVNER